MNPVELCYCFRLPSSPGIAKRTRSAEKRQIDSSSIPVLKVGKPEHSQSKKSRSSSETSDKNKNAITKQSKSAANQPSKQTIALAPKSSVAKEASFESVKSCPVASTSALTVAKETPKGSKSALSRLESVVKETTKGSKSKTKSRKGSGNSVKSESSSSVSLSESLSLSSVGSASTYCSGVSGSNLSSLLSYNQCTDTEKGKKGKRRKSSKSSSHSPSDSLLQSTSGLSLTSFPTPTTSSESLFLTESSKRSLRSSGKKSKKGSKQSSTCSVNLSLGSAEPSKETVLISVDKTVDSVRQDIKEASVALSDISLPETQPPKKKSKWEKLKDKVSLKKERPSTSSSSPPGRSGLRRKSRSKNTGSCASSR